MSSKAPLHNKICCQKQLSHPFAKELIREDRPRRKPRSAGYSCPKSEVGASRLVLPIPRSGL